MPEAEQRTATKESRLSQRTHVLLYGAALMLAFLVLSPVLRSGYLGDDAFNSLYMPATLAVWHTNVFAATAKIVWTWMSSCGRFFPLASFQYALFYVLNDNLLAYKWYLMFMVMGNVALFGTFVRRLTESKSMEILAILALPAVFQLRIFHDAIMSFHGLLQVVTFLTLGALLFLMRYVRERRRLDLIASVTLYAISLITYEVGAPFVLLFFVIAWLYPERRQVRDALRIVWPHLVAVTSAVLIAVALRLTAHVALAGTASSGPYVPNTNPLAALVLLVKQTIATIPLMFYAAVTLAQRLGLLSQQRIFAWPTAYALGDPLAFTLLVVLAGCVTIGVAQRIRSRSPLHMRGAVIKLSAFVGLCLLVLPSVLIATSPALQRQVRWGEGYLPVYISSFGMALLLAQSAYVLIDRARERVAYRVISVGLALLLATTVVTNYENNRVVVEFFNRSWRYPRSTVQDALGRGVLAEVPSLPKVFVKSTRSWETSEFFDVYAHRSDIDLFNLSSSDTTPNVLGDPRPANSLDSSPAVFVESQSLGEGNGFVITGPVAIPPRGAVGDRTLVYEPKRVYLGLRRVSPGAVETPAIATTNTVTGLASVGINPADAQLLDSGSDWALYQLRNQAPRTVTY